MSSQLALGKTAERLVPSFHLGVESHSSRLCLPSSSKSDDDSIPPASTDCNPLRTVDRAASKQDADKRKQPDQHQRDRHHFYEWPWWRGDKFLTFDKP